MSLGLQWKGGMEEEYVTEEEGYSGDGNASLLKFQQKRIMRLESTILLEQDGDRNPDD